MHMTSEVGDKSQPLFSKLKRQAISGAGKPPPIFHPRSDKGKTLIACSYNNIPTEDNMKRGKEIIILNKEDMIDKSKVTQEH